MSERNYYVMCDDKCLFPAMTAEQVVNAIAEATGNTPTHIDDAFITRVREMNANRNLKFWIGTMAQFNALSTKDADTLYIFSDDDTAQSMDTVVGDVANLESAFNALSETVDSRITVIENTIQDFEEGVKEVGHADLADRATLADLATLATKIKVNQTWYDGNQSQPVPSLSNLLLVVYQAAPSIELTFVLFVGNGLQSYSSNATYEISGGGTYDKREHRVRFDSTTRRVILQRYFNNAWGDYGESYTLQYKVLM